MSTPQRLTPGRLPDPWLLDTESLLSELGRVRGLALNIPATRNDILRPINNLIDALWDLEQRLRYCFHLHCEAKRSFAKKHANSLPANQIPKQHCPAASRTTTIRRRHSEAPSYPTHKLPKIASCLETIRAELSERRRQKRLKYGLRLNREADLYIPAIVRHAGENNSSSSAADSKIIPFPKP